MAAHRRVRLDRRHTLQLLLLAALGLIAGLVPLLEVLRSPRPSAGAERRLEVTSSADSGRGSLRAAILVADRASGRVRIRVRAERIELVSPLPPLINPDGIELEFDGTRIDARAVATGPVLDVSAPSSLVRGLALHGARSAAVLVRAPRVRLERLVLRDSVVGVLVGPDAEGLHIGGSTFAGCGSGIVLPPLALRADLAGNRFERSSLAGIWQVAPRPLDAPAGSGARILGSQFVGDRMGVVLINVAGRIDDSTFVGSLDSAIYLGGSPSVVRGNHIRSGTRGITGVDLQGAVIEHNEVSFHVSIGILLQQSRGTVLRDNQVYGNGYGVALVFGPERGPNIVSDNLVARQRHDGIFIVGSSPLVRDNRVHGNESAGMRILDYVSAGGVRRSSAPLLAGNTVSANQDDSNPRGEYRDPAAPAEPAP